MWSTNNLCVIFIVTATVLCPATASVHYSASNKDIQTFPSDIQRSVTHITLTNNKIPEIAPESLKGCYQLTHIQMTRNLLTSFPNLTHVADTLKDFRAEYNKIVYVDPEYLTPLTKLELLSLSGNLISSFPNVFVPSGILHFLYLISNQFSTWPELGLIGRKLWTLSLAHNNLPNIPGENFFQNLTHLKDLQLYNNLITDFPDFGDSSGSLMYLKLYNNRIDTVAYEFLNKLTSLVNLDLHNNRLDDFPNPPGPGNTLQGLNLINNLFKSVPNMDQLGKQMTSLYIGSNVNETSNFAMDKLLNLKIITVHSDGLLKVFPNFGLLAKQIERLDVYRGSIESIDSDMLNNFTSLIRLYVGQNQLNYFPDVPGPGSTLTELYLSENRFTTMPYFNKVGAKLYNLDLSRNQITEIPADTIKALKNLRRLYLYHNRLAVFPDLRMIVNSLEIIHLNNNQLVSIPSEYTDYSNSTKNLKIYMKDNKLENFPPFSGTKSMYFDLWSNPIICDNSIAWITLVDKVNVNGKCDRPVKNKNKLVGSLVLEDIAACSIVEGSVEIPYLLYDTLPETCTKIMEILVKFSTVCSPIPPSLILKLQGDFETAKNYVTIVSVTFTGSGCGSSYISVHASDQEPDSCRSTGTTEWRVRVCDVIGQDKTDFGALKCLFGCPKGLHMYLSFNEYMHNATVCDVAFQRITI